jgi:hypothetical protein
LELPDLTRREAPLNPIRNFVRAKRTVPQYAGSECTANHPETLPAANPPRPARVGQF